MTRLELAIEQIVSARNYTNELLEQTPVTEWFRQPPGGVSHIGWQVGHLACAEYRMVLWRIRGEQPEDGKLIPAAYQGLFGYESVPDPDPARYPGPAELRAVFDRVHERVLREVRGLNDGELDEPVPHPHPSAPTKVLALLWCGRHEMLHTGQIGLLRRQLGYPPLA